MAQPFISENRRERERLRSLTERITYSELNLPVGKDWTVAVALAHLAFWDQRSFVLLQKWKNGEPVAASPIDMDAVNDALLPMLLALPPRKGADLALSSAELIDSELETASEALIAQIEALGEPFRLFRSIHRKLHLDEIEELLKGPRR